MCRLYGFRANEETKVECSLVHAQNALLLQSQSDLRGRAHPHGWGLAFYHNSHPTVERCATAAYQDIHFSETVERIYTGTVVAHVRFATVGEPLLENSHPFAHGVWTFAHNGTVAAFDRLKSRMTITPELQQCVHGTTDSEHTFYWLLSRMQQAGISLSSPCREIEQPARIVAAAVDWLASRGDALGSEKPATLNFILTDGVNLVASRWNNTLSYVTRQGLHDCEICGIPHVHHRPGFAYRAVVVASEPVTHVEQWQEVPERSLLTIDPRLHTDVRPISTLLQSPGVTLS